MSIRVERGMISEKVVTDDMVVTPNERRPADEVVEKTAGLIQNT